ncbi:SpaA isopeptide-forming pilin-related protein, partial [Bacillus sp. D-CC]
KLVVDDLRPGNYKLIETKAPTYYDVNVEPIEFTIEKGQLEFLSLEDYVSLVVDQLEMIPEDVIVHRITGDGPPDLMIGPMWSLNKWEVLNSIDAEFVRRGSWQGKYANEEKQQ